MWIETELRIGHYERHTAHECVGASRAIEMNTDQGDGVMETENRRNAARLGIAEDAFESERRFAELGKSEVQFTIADNFLNEARGGSEGKSAGRCRNRQIQICCQ